MRGRKICGAHLLAVFAVAFISMDVKADDFNSEAVSQVSKAIAEWKLLNKDKSETSEHRVYVSSSLSQMTEGVESDGLGVVSGLAAFNNDQGIESQIRQYELNKGVMISSQKTSDMAKIWAVNPTLMNTAMKTQLGTGVKMTNIGPAWGPINTIHSGWGTATKVFNTCGTAMQTINPPIYLNQKASYGWKGEGSYTIPDGYVHYRETLSTAGPNPITRIHTDWATTNMGTYYRNIEIKTPVLNNFERFALNRFPTGSYWDPQTSTSVTTTRIQQSYRTETIGGYTKITPLPSSVSGTWNNVPINWNNTVMRTPKINWNNTVMNAPKVNWNNIPKTNYVPKTNLNK